MNGPTKTAFVIVFMLYLVSTGWAGEFTWTGEVGDNDWHNPDNWEPVGIPDNEAEVWLVAGQDINISADRDIELKTLYIDSVAVSLDAGGNSILLSGDLHCYAPGQTITLKSNLQARNLVFYAGTIKAAGVTITSTEDLVLLGEAYNVNQTIPDPAGGSRVIEGLFRYDHPQRGEYLAENDPNAQRLAKNNVELLAEIPAPGPGPATTIDNNYGTKAADLTGACLDIGKNFYCNGVNLANNSGSWELWLRSDVGKASTAFAEAYNSRVNYCQVKQLDEDGPENGVGWVAAAEKTIDEGFNSGWAFSRSTLLPGSTPGADGEADPKTPIVGCCTISDDIIRVAIQGLSDDIRFENSNNELYSAFKNGQFSLHNGMINVIGVYSDAACSQETLLTPEDLDHFYLKVAPGDRWNTDANGDDPGAVDSTDRGRQSPAAAPTHRTIIPNLSVPQATNDIIWVLKDNYGNRLTDYSSESGNTFKDISDRTRPVLISVAIGQALHYEPNSPAYTAYDAHNYIKLIYSEPVNIGPNSEGGFTLRAGETIVNWRGDSYWNQAGGSTDPAPDNKNNGAIGGDIVAPSSTNKKFNLMGWLEVPGTNAPAGRGVTAPLAAVTPNAGLEPNGPVTTAFYREASAPNRVMAYVAGWAEEPNDGGTKWSWPGWVRDLEQISGPVLVPANPNIRDRVGNSIEPTADPSDNRYGPGGDKAEISVTTFGAGWDCDPPAPAVIYQLPDWQDKGYEIIAKSSGGDGFIDRIEFHILDNGSEAKNWASLRGWFEGDPPPTGDFIADSFPDKHDGIRSRTLRDPSAFTIGFRSKEGEFYVQYGSGFDDHVNHPLFGSSEISGLDIPYFTLLLNNTTKKGSVDWIRYEDRGRITDLAGNLMPTSYTPPKPGETIGKDYWQVTEKTEPTISLSLAAFGKTKVYVQFSENCLLLEGSPDVPLKIIDRDGNDLDLISTYRWLPSDPPARALELTLNKPVSLDLLLHGQIQAVAGPDFVDGLTGLSFPGSYLANTGSIQMSPERSHRLTDLALGVVEVLMASDGVNLEAGLGSGFMSALTVFDGSGELLPEDVSVYCRLAEDDAGELARPSLFFTIDPPANVRPTIDYPESLTGKDFWLPTVLAGFNRTAAVAQEVSVSNSSLSYTIPKAAQEKPGGRQTQFLFGFKNNDLAQPLYAARLCQPELDSVEGLLNFDLWRYQLRGMQTQRGGVTILNNVIDPGKDQKTTVRVELANPGRVIVQVFSLDGELIRTLNRDTLSAGSYNFSWNGRNSGGSPVAIGIYFIRVITNDLDEIRKVLVVRD